MHGTDWIWLGGLTVVIVLCWLLAPVRIRSDWWAKIRRRDRDE